MQQDSRWSPEQLAVIKSALAENETAITAIRKIFLEDELTKNEEKALKLAVRDKEEVQEVLRRHYSPELVVDAPIGQVQDRFLTIPVEQLTPEMATLQADAMEKMIACLNGHLEELFTGKPGMSYKSLYRLNRGDAFETYVGLLARNKYITTVEQLTHHLSLLAGKKEETPDQTMERLRKDSAK